MNGIEERDTIGPTAENQPTDSERRIEELIGSGKGLVALLGKQPDPDLPRDEELRNQLGSGASYLLMAFDTRLKQSSGADKPLTNAFLKTCFALKEAINPLLLLVVAAAAGIRSVVDEFRDRALEKLSADFEGYRRILGPLLPADLLNSAESRWRREAYDSGRNPTAAGDWQEYAARMRTRQTDLRPGLATAIAPLDNATGGLRGATFLGGPSGVGKTSLALQIAYQSLQADTTTAALVLSLDMDKTVIYDRLLSLVSGLPYTRLLAMERSRDEQERVNAAAESLSVAILPRLKVVTQTELNAAVSRDGNLSGAITGYLDALLVDGVQRVLTVVDYFQLLPAAGQIQEGLDRDHHLLQEVLAAHRWTINADAPAGMPFLLISEVRKTDGIRGALGIEDLRGSARLGYGAEAVLMLEPDGDPTNESSPVVLRLVKGRDGTHRTSIPLVFRHTASRFDPRGPKTKAKTKAATPAAKNNSRARDPLAGSED